MEYQVVKEYQDAPKSPIQIVKGEKLQFVEESDPEGDWPNWVFCRGINKEGWVPKQILVVKNSEVTVLEDYLAKEHNLTVGEMLVQEHELNGWIWSKKLGKSEELAWAPLNHLCAV
ncbi:SH3 domain-containing protein [Vibrio bivalvicida]|uniref:SH3 domain-containing protein n=1 Tax=Vibrio bivalvicida TaxID=1276888 RepID=A0ABV4MMA5_9VIBR